MAPHERPRRQHADRESDLHCSHGLDRNINCEQRLILYWERSGFCLWQKRLEQERFKWPEHLTGAVLTLDGQQLNWLLDGYDLAAMRPHRSLAYRTVL